MTKFKAAITAIIITAGSAVSAAAAADMPVPSAFAPLRLEAEHVERARLICNDWGRCFRAGPPPIFYGPPVFVQRPRVFVHPVYRGPEYEVERSYRQRYADVPQYEYRRSEEYRRSYGDRRDDGPEHEYRRPREYRHTEADSRREEWSHEDRRSESEDRD